MAALLVNESTVGVALPFLHKLGLNYRLLRVFLRSLTCVANDLELRTELNREVAQGNGLLISLQPIS